MSPATSRVLQLVKIGDELETRNGIIGASLSEPHTSVTALSTCVYIWLAMLGPTIYHKLQISAFEILIFHDVHTTCSYFSHRLIYYVTGIGNAIT